jgi:hypothetical protein
MLLPYAAAAMLVLAILWHQLSPKYRPQLYHRFLFLTRKELGDEKDIRTLLDKYGGHEVRFSSRSAADVAPHSLQAWVFGEPNACSQLVLYAIGRDGDIARRARSLDLLLSCGVAVFIYEHSGYGKSDGKPSLPQLCADAVSAYDFALATFGKSGNDIVLYGESFGGAILTRLLGERDAAALILKSSFASFIKIAKELCIPLNVFPRCMFPSPHLDTAGRLRNLNKPVLIIHGRRDKIASWRHAEKLLAASRGELVELPNSRHSYIKPEDEAIFVAGVRTFLSRVRASNSVLRETMISKA